MSDKRRQAVQARENVLDQLQLEGLEAAYRRAIRLLDDDTAPATAHASIIRAIFDVGGLRAGPDDDRPKELHEMTAEEVDEALEEARARLQERCGLFD